VGKPKGKRPLENPRSRWEDNVKMDFSGSGVLGAWTGLIWPRIEIDGGHF
jgi:hypothetical protein